MIQLKQYKKAYDYIQEIVKEFNGVVPPKVNLAYAYLLLVNGDNVYFNHIIGQECENFDGISCWILMQNLTQKKFNTLLNSKDYILADLPNVTKETVRNYKNINEEVFVDQKEIEELDAEAAFN